MTLLNKILQAVLEVALPILVSAAATWAVGKAREVFQRLKEDKPETYYILREIVERAVVSAEQIYQGAGRGEEKKEYVLNLIENYLKSRGIVIDAHMINAYIEAEVRKQNLELQFEKIEAEYDNVQTALPE